MLLFRGINLLNKRNLSSYKTNNIFFNTKLNLYKYFKLPIEKRIQVKIDKKNKKDINLDLYQYFKLPVEKRKDFILKIK